MKHKLLPILFSVFLSFAAFCQPKSIDLKCYQIKFASGYVNQSNKNFSGDMNDIGSKPFGTGQFFNSGFMVFDGSTLPTGAKILSAVVQLNSGSASTTGGETGNARLTGLSKNPIVNQNLTKQDITAGIECANDIDWTTGNKVLTGTFSTAGIAFLQSKLGTAIPFGLDPPTSTKNKKAITGYSSTNAIAPAPILKITYEDGTAVKPKAAFFQNKNSIFMGDTVSFFDNSGNYPNNWKWSIGNNLSSNLQNPKIIFTDTGYFDVKLKASNAAGSDSVTILKAVYVAPVPAPPVCSFEANKINAPAGSPIVFTNTSTGVINTRLWRFGDNEVSSTNAPSHSYLNPGVYTVTLIVSGPFGADTLTKVDYITIISNQLKPKSDFSFNQQGSFEYQFTDLSENLPTSWNWDFDDEGEKSTSQNPVHIFSSTGIKNICLISTNQAGSDTICKKINITERTKPKAEFSFKQIGHTDISFTDLSKNVPNNWYWEFGDSSISIDQNPIHTYPTTGEYNVCFYSINDAGTDTVCKKIVVALWAGIFNNSLSENKIHFLGIQNGKLIFRVDENKLHNPIISIVDLNGKLIYRNQSSLKSSNIEIPMLNFSSGLYCINMQDAKQSISSKFIISH